MALRSIFHSAFSKRSCGIINFNDSCRQKCRQAFTLFEIIIALSVLTFGISYIFRIFFNSLSVSEHILNRLKAQQVLDDRIWQMKNIIKDSTIKEEDIQRKISSDSGKFKYIAHLRKKAGFDTLYSLEVDVFWIEGKRSIHMERFVYVVK